MRRLRPKGIRNSVVGAVVEIVSVRVVALIPPAPLQLFVPVPGLNAPLASDGSPEQVKVRGTWVVLLLVWMNPFVPATVRLIVAADPALTE
jgi:hypothetical protein